MSNKKKLDSSFEGILLLTMNKEMVVQARKITSGVKSFCRIRGYISIVKKNSLNVLDAIERVFHGRPFLPEDYLTVRITDRAPPI